MSESHTGAKIAAAGTLGAALIGGVVAVYTSRADSPEPTPALVRVARVELSADVGTFSARCPITIDFTGRIDVESGTGEVIYRWLRSDGFMEPTSVGDRETVAVDGPGTVLVTDEWTANIPVGEVARTNVLEVLEPRNMKSEPVLVSGRCDADLPEGPPVPPPQVPGGPPG
jgi:hypothetical protein